MDSLYNTIDVFVSGDWGNENSIDLDHPIQVSCIRGADIVPIERNEYNNIPQRFITSKSFSEKKLKEGDIIIEKSGGSPVQSTGRVVYVSKKLLEAHPNLVCSNFCVAIRIKKNWNPLYIFYYIKRVYEQGLFFNFEGKTSGIKNLDVEAAYKAIPIEYRNRSEQDKSISLLTSIERKITVNRQINRNLEALAKQLYDYWFVQFDFPNEEGKPYKSSGGAMMYNERLKREIPNGWAVTSIGCILDKVVTTPRLSTDEYLPSGIYPVIDQTSNVYYAGFTDRKNAVVNQFPAVVFGDHSCAVKYVNFPFVRGADGTQVMLSKETNISTEYLYFVVKGIKIGKGYARHYSFLKEQPIIVPPQKEAKKFERVAQIVFEQITRNRKENLSMTKQRDELLPLLMNGQVSVNSDLSHD